MRVNTVEYALRQSQGNTQVLEEQSHIKGKNRKYVHFSCCIFVSKLTLWVRDLKTHHRSHVTEKRAEHNHFILSNIGPI